MAEDALRAISERLSSTIRETNELFRGIQPKDSGVQEYSPGVPVSGTKLKKIETLEGPDKKWVLPYTLPVGTAPADGSHREVYNFVGPRAPVLSGRHGHVAFQAAKNEADLAHGQTRPEWALDGWTERQKRVFLKFAAESENKMRMESLRLQDEYNKQLASKLALVKNELYETNRRSLLELQEMRLERERWALEEAEVRQSLETVSASLESLQKSYDNARCELEARDFQVSNLNGELASYERLVDSLRAENAALQKDLHDKSEFVARLQGDVADAYLRLEAESSKLASADRDLASVNLSRRELNEQNKELRVQLDNLLLKNKFMLAERESLENRNQRLEQEVAERGKEALALQNRLRSLEVAECSRVSALEEKLQAVTLKLKSAQIDLVAADKRLELGTLQRELDALRAQLKQANGDNDALFKENSLLQRRLDEEKALVKEHLNELYAARCKAQSLRTEVKGLRESLAWATRHERPGPGAGPQEELLRGLGALSLAPGKPARPAHRDLFAPTMFQGPDEATRAKIEALEKQLTELHLEKDRLESEMTRCKLGPGSPTLQRRQYFLLEEQVAEVARKIGKLSGEIKALYNS